MKGWWSSLSDRDRRLGLVAIVAVAAWLLWLLAWRPLTQGRDQWQRNAELAETELHWMREAALQLPNVQRLEPKDRGNQSLFALAQQSAVQVGLGNAFRRGEQDGAASVQIWLENAPYDQLVNWLQALQRDYAIVAVDANLDRVGAGIVNARLRLQEPL